MNYFTTHPHLHPTAEEVYDVVKKQEQSIGIATIYRNLKKLVDGGMLRELKLEKQGVRYDLVEHEHYHFICDTCGTIENFVIDELKNINPLVEKTTHGLITSKDLMFHGICHKCLSSDKKR